MTSLVFVGKSLLAQRGEQGGITIHPFAASAADDRQASARELSLAGSSPFAVGLRGKSIVLATEGDSNSLVLQWISSRGSLVRRRECPSGGFTFPSASQALAQLIPVTPASGPDHFYLQDAQGRVHLVAEGRVRALDEIPVAALAASADGTVFSVSRTPGGFRPQALAGSAKGVPPLLVPESGEQAFLGHVGRTRLSHGLTALEGSSGDFLLAAGSAEERRQGLPAQAKPIGVARAAGATGEVRLLCLRDDRRTLSLVGESGERSLPPTNAPCFAVAVSTETPFLATLDERGELVVRCLTGPGDRRVYRHRPLPASV